MRNRSIGDLTTPPKPHNISNRRYSHERDEILQRLRPAIRAAQDRVMAPLSDREREMLIDLLARVIKARDVKAGSGSE